MRNNKFINPFLFTLFILAIFSIYSNYKNLKVSNKQITILKAIGSGDYDFSDDYIKRISTGYPNLTQTVIPFNSIIGAHWVNKDSFELGLEYLRKGNKDNPYLGFSDMLLAHVYQNMGVKDSFEYYTMEASKKLPNNPAHFALLGKILLAENKLDSFNSKFKEIIKRVPDREVWRLYLAAMVEHKYKFDTIEVYENARNAKLIFADKFDQRGHKTLHLTADYVLYGVENVKKAIELRQVAVDSFNDNPNLSIKKLKEAIDLVPDNISYYETLLEIQFRNKYYEDVLVVYDTLNKIGMTSLRGSTVEFIAISYLNTNDKLKGCYLAKILANTSDYNLSPDVRAVCNIF